MQQHGTDSHVTRCRYACMLTPELVPAPIVHKSSRPCISTTAKFRQHGLQGHLTPAVCPDCISQSWHSPDTAAHILQSAKLISAIKGASASMLHVDCTAPGTLIRPTAVLTCHCGCGPSVGSLPPHSIVSHGQLQGACRHTSSQRACHVIPPHDNTLHHPALPCTALHRTAVLHAQMRVPRACLAGHAHGADSLLHLHEVRTLDRTGQGILLHRLLQLRLTDREPTPT